MCAAGESDDPRGADADRIVRVVERVREAGLDPRVLGAWRSWLSALASDAEAALAAAMAYSSLGDDARNAWLDALEADAASVDVPKIALYAPLLAVEADGARRARMTDALSGGDDANAAFVGDFASDAASDSSREGASNRSGAPSRPIEALAGTTASGDSVCVILLPVYLDFVEMLVCRYHPDTGIVSAHHDPLRHASDAPRASEREVEEGVLLRPAPLRMVVEDLAHAVVADRREGRDAPPEVMRFSHLFVPDLDRDPMRDPIHDPVHDPARDPMRDSKPDADAS